MRLNSSIRVSALAAIFFAMLARDATAQNSSAIAEGLFRDGKRLLEQKKFAEACPKFEESVRLDPSSGVQLALGFCYEGLGKLASAWGAFTSAQSLARRDGRKDREKAASEHAAALESKLSHVTFDVPADMAQLPGLVVKEDGVAIGAVAWKNSPVDAGDHTLEITATDKRPFKSTFTVGKGESKTVPISALEDEPHTVVTGGGNTATTTITTHPYSTVGIVSLGVGGAGVIVGAILGSMAIGSASDARKTCSPPQCSDLQAVNEMHSAATLADYSTALFIVGGVGLAASAVFFLVTNKKTVTTGFHPLVGPGAIGLGGTW